MPDVRARIAMARQRFGKMRHLWDDKNLHVKLRMRLYKASVCSILTYGSEAWTLTKEVRRAINGANSQMVSVITGKTPHQEASGKWRTFDLVMWIRARRLQWTGHILRMGSERKLKQALYEMFVRPREGDMLMDVPNTNGSWRELLKYAVDKDYWRTRVRAMRQPRVRVEIKPRVKQPVRRSTRIRDAAAATSDSAAAESSDAAAAATSICDTTVTSTRATNTATTSGIPDNVTSAKRYRDRDVHEIFLRPGKHRKQPPKKKRIKKNPRPLTNKERTPFARTHYEHHHGKGQT